MSWYIENEGDYPTSTDFQILSDDIFTEPYPDSLWRISANHNNGYPYNNMLQDMGMEDAGENVAILVKAGFNLNRKLCVFHGLSTDTKPIDSYIEQNSEIKIESGSEFYEIDTSTKYLYDKENRQWYAV